MLEKEKHNKNGTKDIGIQAFNTVLQLGEGYRLIALLISQNVLGPSYMPFTFIVDHSMFQDVSRRPCTGEFSTPCIKSRKARRTTDNWVSPWFSLPFMDKVKTFLSTVLEVAYVDL